MHRTIAGIVLGSLSALAFAACFPQEPSGSTSTTSSSTTSSTGTGGAASACDGKKDCNTCLMCAGSVVCAAVASACQQNPSCVGLDQCLTICGADADCKSQCNVGNPDGVNDYVALISCLYCKECPGDCAGFATCT